MNLFPVSFPVKRKIVCLIPTFFLLFSCATKHVQYGNGKPDISDSKLNNDSISHTFYLLGDAGNADTEGSQKLLSEFSSRLQNADTTSTLLILGDNIYQSGLPEKDDPDYPVAMQKLDIQLEVAKKFKGRTIFIPGNHDWYNGVKGLKAQEDHINDILGKKSFLPKNGCGIADVKIDKNIALIVIDSEWLLEDWDDHPTINKECSIKTREQFYDELEGLINKNQNKVTLIAMHHPIFSNGPHGGQFSLRKQFFPLKTTLPMPVIGSLLNLLRKTSGASPEDLQNKGYSAFVRRIGTMLATKDNVIILSGHEHNLQYIERGNIRQVISGSGSKEEAARAFGKNDFSFGHLGYAELNVMKNGGTEISYFGLDSIGREKLLFRANPVKPAATKSYEFGNAVSTTNQASVYTGKMAKRSGIYRFFWGNHYRKYYGMQINAASAMLDTVHGGLKPESEGGGHQSLSLRLEDKDGKEYTMRALRKSATRFLQTGPFKEQPVEEDFRNTYSEAFIMDFYTTEHPFTPFIVAGMADKAGIRHTNPELFYIPKQKALGRFNENFGDGLYMIEERPMDKFKNIESFGKPDHIVSTDEVLENIHLDPKYYIDEESYIRARIFDMLIGDWDRHDDNWRWAQYKEPRKIVYRPIPRDRDNAFFKTDGALMSILMNIPALRHMKKFSSDLKNVKWFNREAYPLDLALITKSNKEVWLAQARYIIDNLTDADIDKAFGNLPKEVRDETANKIKQQLKIRKTHLEEYAVKYYEVLQKTVMVVGTEKKDRFVIERIDNTTKVSVYKIRIEGEQLIHQRIYEAPETKEIWVYGLNEDDIFEVKGRGHNRIKVRLIGGHNNDTYNIESGRRVSIYDFKSTKNTVNNQGHARVVLSDNYDLNTYDFEKPTYNVFAGYPLLGYNPDDGVKIGGVINYKVNGFNRFPYSQKHSIGGNYYFATSGFELTYKGVFPHAIGRINFKADVFYTSPNFSINYFGFGNETINPDDEFSMDYNRVRIKTLRIAPALQWVGKQGGSAALTGTFEQLKPEPSPGRFISEPNVVNPDVFGYKNFADLNFEYAFKNYDNPSNPTLGITFAISSGYKVNTDNADRKFSYAESELGFSYKLVPDGRLVLSTLFKGKAIFDNRFEFYHAASLGGDYDLRGFRRERFLGRQSFFESTDLRLNLGKLRTGFVPASFGIFGGFDYGRVWLPGEYSDKWHQSAGGGVWLNALNVATGRFSCFFSEDGVRLAVGLGFGF